MTDNVLTYEQALAELERLVEEKGADFVYQSPALVWDYAENEEGDEERTGWHLGEPSDSNGDCINWLPDGTPSCIVGHLIRHLFPDVEPTCEVMDDGPERTLKMMGITADHDTLLLLYTVQCSQDNGATWGDAVEKAKEGLYWRRAGSWTSNRGLMR